MRNDFIQWIDNFTNKFILSLKDIEQSEGLKEFIGEDGENVLTTREAQRQIRLNMKKILTNTSKAAPRQKA